MSAEALLQTLLGNRRASQYVFSLPPGEFEEHLDELRITKFVVSDEDPEMFRLAGTGYFPLIYLEYRVVFESDVPKHDVPLCLTLVRQNPIPPPRVVIVFLQRKQAHMVSLAMRFMCIARSEPEVKRVAPKRARAVYDCRAGEHWVEVHFSKAPISTTERLVA